jgi:MFS family permease
MDDNCGRVLFHLAHLYVGSPSGSTCKLKFYHTEASTASSFALGYPSLTRDLSTSQFEATVGFSMYTLGFAVVPLVTASFSEEFGRRPLYLVSGLGFGLMCLMIAEYVFDSPPIIRRNI